MPSDPGVAAYIARWRPSSVSPPAAAFAREAIARAEPEGKERAKNLLWAAGKLADYAIGLGLETAPQELYAAKSHTVADIAKLLGVSRQTVYRALEPGAVVAS